jgi:predicted glycosyltransferase
MPRPPKRPQPDTGDVLEQPDILFIPVTGGTGLGEYARCLTIARALHQRRPDARIRFIINRSAGLEPPAPFHVHPIDRSPTLNTPAVNDIIRTDPPDVVVFDNAGRLAQLRCALDAGARTVFVSARPRKRRKAFRPAWLRRLDQHWIVQPARLELALTPVERLLMRLINGPRILLLHTIFEQPDPAAQAALRLETGLDDAAYVLFAPGGGGYSVHGRPSPEVFAQAAAVVAARTGIRTVVVLGPLYKARLPHIEGPTVLPSVDTADMANLIDGARLVAVGGGGLLIQALAMGKPCVVAAAGGRDQPRRIREILKLGAAVAAPPDPEPIADAAISLLQDAGSVDALETRARSLSLRNGLPQALDALALLLPHQADTPVDE